MKQLTSRQEEIINASIEIISEKGIQNLTIKNLSKAIGISEPAIYRHFESKMDILLTILSKFENYIITDKDINRNIGLSPMKKLEGIFSHHFSYFEKNPAFAAVVFAEEIFRDDKRLSEKIHTIMKRNFEMMLLIVKDGQAKGEIRKDIEGDQIILIIMGALRLIVKKWKLSDHSFNIISDGKKLWRTVKKLISA
ncbi:MAG: TetR/AcrR family transcriptional regulator [Candidatus Aminicenantes bacterium]|nr:TetR/AcrR family transcriptional regulator [Candidatus Aminicenantes bacterium]